MALRVFLVEDSAATRAHLMSVLVTEAGVTIAGIADSEKQAIDWLDSNPGRWDVALVDLFLREGTGAGVLEHCRERHANQRVLVMTNHAQDDALLQDCKLLGADAVYHKGTGLDALVAHCLRLAAKTSRSIA